MAVPNGAFAIAASSFASGSRLVVATDAHAAHANLATDEYLLGAAAEHVAAVLGEALEIHFDVEAARQHILLLLALLLLLLALLEPARIQHADAHVLGHARRRYELAGERRLEHRLAAGAAADAARFAGRRVGDALLGLLGIVVASNDHVVGIGWQRHIGHWRHSDGRCCFGDDRLISFLLLLLLLVRVLVHGHLVNILVHFF